MYYLIVNAAHLNDKSKKQLETVKKVFEDAGKEYEVLLTTQAGDDKLFTEKITKAGGEHTIIAMGGDGTLHAILNGMSDLENFSLGLIPFGTGNDFAEGTGIPFDVKKAAEIIAYGTPKPIDFIELSSGLRSINVIGMGIDVDVIERTFVSKNKSRSKYITALMYCLRHFDGYPFIVKYDGKEEKHFGLIAAIGNSTQFGGGIKMFPDAKIDDGYLDLVMIDFVSRPKILGTFIKLMTGRSKKIKEATYVRTKSATILCDNEKYSMQAEGELYENIPLEAHIVEGKLKFYLP